MGSLTEAYDQPVGSGGRRTDSDRTASTDNGDALDAGARSRPYLAIGLLAAASAFVIAGIVIATSDTAAVALDLTRVEANELARVIAGVGVPTGLVGVLAALALPRRVRSIGALGLTLSVVGIGAFLWAYPDRWLGDPLDLTLPVAVVYLVGLLVTFLSMVAGILAFGRESSGAGESTEPSADRGAPDRDRKNRTSLR